MENEIKISCTPGMFNLLTVLFVALKLTGYINWSWWWVLAPSWIPFVVAIVLIILYSIVYYNEKFNSSRRSI